MTLDGDLDSLYGVAPEAFTALRKQLAAAAKKTGNAAAAKEIASARRPTAAAWVVNVLVRADPTAKTRLGEMTAELRAAHAAMDGVRIRELTTAQRRLVAELVGAAFAAAGVAAPGAVLRDDVTGTLQAAIADPEVASRLGRLEKAAQWSGFGEFGASFEDGPTAAVAEPKPPRVSRAELRAAEKRRADAAAAVDASGSALTSARRRHERQLETLAATEHELHVAEAEHEHANGALEQADATLTALRGDSPT